MNKGTEKPRIDSDADGFVTYDSPSQGPTVIGRFRPWGGVNVNDTRKMIEIDGKSFHVPSNLTPGAAVVNLVYPVDGRFMRNRGEQGYGKNFFAHVAEVRNALIAAQTAPTKTAKDKAAATDLNATAQRGLNRIVTYIADVYPRDLTFVGGELAHTTPLGEAVVNELQAGLNPRFSTGATTRARRTERPTTLLDGE